MVLNVSVPGHCLPFTIGYVTNGHFFIQLSVLADNVQIKIQK